MSSINERDGAVAILDALGTSHQHHEYITKFLDSRNRVLGLLNGKAEGVELEEKVSTFTFGDTILITLTSSPVGLAEDCIKFMTVLRKFLVDSLHHGLLFRGAMAIGKHYADDDSNTVLGPAVEDAAAWYEEANWIGLHATPLSSMKLEAWREKGVGPQDRLIVDYSVPLKKGPQLLKAVNWPKVLFVRGIAPTDAHDTPREYLLSKLTARQIPIGCENKYTNTLAFFDSVVKEQKLKPIAKKNTVKVRVRRVPKGSIKTSFK